MIAVQYFEKEYLEHCRKASTAEILDFLENFRLMHAYVSGSKLISIRMPLSLLRAFQAKAELKGVRYQEQIKRLMSEWVSAGSTTS